MNNAYQELKNQHQKEVNDFPMIFAFSKEQFKEGMEKWGLTENNTDKVYSIGMGGICRKSDASALKEMTKRHNLEMEKAIKNDKTGDRFIFDMFYYELGNHEYCYTGDTEDTIEALGFTRNEINQNEVLAYGLKKACQKQRENDN